MKNPHSAYERFIYASIEQALTRVAARPGRRRILGPVPAGTRLLARRQQARDRVATDGLRLHRTGLHHGRARRHRSRIRTARCTLRRRVTPPGDDNQWPPGQRPVHRQHPSGHAPHPPRHRADRHPPGRPLRPRALLRRQRTTDRNPRHRPPHQRTRAPEHPTRHVADADSARLSGRPHRAGTRDGPDLSVPTATVTPTLRRAYPDRVSRPPFPSVGWTTEPVAGPYPYGPADRRRGQW